MRLVAYVRVSRVGGREGPSFISPEIQRAQIEGWAAGRAEIIAWHTDLDVSGGTMERPGLDRAMEPCYGPGGPPCYCRATDSPFYGAEICGG